MRVLFTNDPPLIKYGIAQGFQQLKHEIHIMQGERERLWGQPLSEQRLRLEQAIEVFKPDFVFTEGHPDFDPETVCKTIRDHKIPHVYWAIEDPVCTNLSTKTYIPYADWVFTTTAECVPFYRSLGKRAELLLFGCNPRFHYFRGEDPEYRHDLVLVATNYSSRYAEAEWLVMPFVERGYDIKIWGLWWDDPSRPVHLGRYPGKFGGLLPYEELPVVYSSAKIILGMNCDSSSITQTSMRPYEALACGGGLYLGHYTKAQKHIFKELIFQVRNTAEAIRTVNRLLALGETERKAMALKAQREVYQKHSYLQRASQVLRAVAQL